MRKRKICYGMKVVLCFIMACCCMAGCGAASSYVQEETPDPIGTFSATGEIISDWPEPPKVEFHAADIPDVKLDQSYAQKVSKIVEGKGAFREAHEKLIVEALKGLGTVSMDPDWLREKEFYVSKIPVYKWDADENEILYGIPNIFVFSKKLDKIGCIELFSEKNDGNYERIGSMDEEVDDDIEMMFKNDRDKKFFLVAEIKGELTLGENNEVISGYRISKEFVGNYTKKLDKIGLSVSMGQLMDKKNLVKVTISAHNPVDDDVIE